MNGASLDRAANRDKKSAMLSGMRASGQNTAMPQILNNKCENATATAAGCPVTSAANSAVVVVPMLAPMV